MQFSRKSFSNLAALESGEDSMAELQGTPWMDRWVDGGWWTVDGGRWTVGGHFF